MIKLDLSQLTGGNSNNSGKRFGMDDDILNIGNQDISVVQNHIYFHTDVNPSTILRLKNELTRLVKNNVGYAVTTDTTVEPIYLHLSSPGGYVHEGLSAYDYISAINKKVPVITIVEGNVASAATLISIAGSKRYITPNSFMLIHEIRSWFYGQFTKITEEYSNLCKLQDTVNNIYLKYTNFSAEELKALVNKDIILNADECLEHGLVDEIKTIIM